MKITLTQIMEAASHHKAYERGLEYYQVGRVGKVKVEDLKEYMQVTATVEGHSGTYEARAELYQDEISWTECDCIASFTYEGACKHVVALLLKYYHEIQTAQGSIKGQKYTENVLAYYENQMLKKQELESGEEAYITIRPKLIEEVAGSYSLSISVGDKKFYIVKDLYEFTENVMGGQEHSYGKNLEFTHDMECFKETSRPLIQFIIDKTQEYQDLLRQVGMYRGFPKSERKILPLGAKAFDEFFDLMKGQEVELLSQGEVRNISCKEENPKLELKVEQGKDHYELMTSMQEYIPFHFSKYKYILTQDTLYRLEQGFAEDVYPLLAAMYEAKRSCGKKELHFSETLMKRFMLSSLEQVEAHIPVQMEEEVKEAVAPEHVKVKVYLDLNQEGHMIGDLLFEYPSLSFNPYERLSPEQTKVAENIARDTRKEYLVETVLRNYEFRTHKGQLYLNEEEAIYKFLKTGLQDLMAVSEVHVTDKLKALHIVHKPIGSLGLKVESNMLQVALNEVNMPLEEMKEVLNAYRLKSKYYRLKSGSFIDLTEDEVESFANLVEGLGIEAKDLEKGTVEVPKYRALYLDQVLKQSEGLEVNRDKYFKQILRDVKNIEDADYEVPSSIKASLRSYQKLGYRWLRTMSAYGFGGILADDMGLGKTLQVITLLAAEQQGDKPSLVVCPTSLVLNWETELKKFAPELRSLIMMGSVEERRALLKQIEEVDVVITSYELLRRDSELYEEVQFKYCIADEAQSIKNANTLSAKALKLVKSEGHFALTGTPIENSLAELWSLFDFIMPGYLFSYSKFKKDFETPIVKNQDEVVTARLKKMIAPFIIRRLKKEVLKELPDKIETVIYNTMEEEQQKLYKAHLAQAKQEMEQALETEGAGKSHIKMLALLTRLRQLCCHPSLYLQGYEADSGKLLQCMELVRDSIEGGHKILIFSQFTSMLALISKTLTKENIEHFTLTGSTKAEERMRLVEAFNHSEVPVFLISLKAGGTGLNLTGADVVIHYDPWWNLSSQNQATDRAYRIGQRNNVQVFQMITKDSIEEKIKELQDKKIGLTESVLQEGEAFISKMSEEEIKQLFSE